MPIDREEFREAMRLLREDIAGVNARLDELNGRTRVAEQKIAVLDERTGAGKAAAWGGGVAGALLGIVELIKWMNGAPK